VHEVVLELPHIKPTADVYVVLYHCDGGGAVWGVFMAVLRSMGGFWPLVVLGLQLHCGSLTCP
jgi:hypothetical protein